MPGDRGESCADDFCTKFVLVKASRCGLIRKMCVWFKKAFKMAKNLDFSR